MLEKSLSFYPRPKAGFLTEVTDTGLSSVVRSLELRYVDNVTAHGGSSDKTSVGEVLQLVTVQVGTLLLLSSPVGSSSASTVPGSVEICLNNIEIVLDGSVNSGTLGPRDTGIGDENVKTTVEVLNSLVDGSLRRRNLTFYAILLLNLSSTLGCLVVCVVE